MDHTGQGLEKLHIPIRHLLWRQVRSRNDDHIIYRFCSPQGYSMSIPFLLKRLSWQLFEAYLTVLHIVKYNYDKAIYGGFCNKIRMLRKEKGLTQKELANLLGFFRGALSLYEIGQREPDYEANIMFDGAPLDDEDKDDVIEFIKLALRTLKKRKRERGEATADGQ